MRSGPTSPRRALNDQIRQLREELPGRLADIPETLYAFKTDAEHERVACLVEWRETLSDTVGVVKALVLDIRRLSDLERLNAQAAGNYDDCLEFPALMTALDQLGVATYGAANKTDELSEWYNESDDEAEWVLSDQLWDEGTLCDELLAHLGSIGVGPCVTSRRPRPARHARAVEAPRVEKTVTVAERPVTKVRTFGVSLREAIDVVLRQGLIVQKQDFAAVHRAVVEMRCFDRLPYTDFVRMLGETGVVPEALMPSADNIRKVAFSGTLPDWRVQQATPQQTERLVAIGLAFKEAFR